MGNLVSSVFSIASTANAQQRPSEMKEFPEHLKASAVISVSNQGESCREGVLTVLATAKFWKELHIVYFPGSDSTVYYSGFEKDLEELRSVGLEPIRHCTFNHQKMSTGLRVNIPPDCEASEGALYMIFDAMMNRSTNETGVASQLYLEAPPNQPRIASKDFLEALLAYGIIVVLLVFDTLRSVFRLSRYNRTCDLYARRVNRIYPGDMREAPERSYMWWIFTGTSATQRGGQACLQRPEDTGFAFLIRSVKTHRYMSWTGVWWLGFLSYYLLFAWPWWNVFLSPQTRLGVWLIRDLSTSTFWQMLYILHTLFVGVIFWVNVEHWPYKLQMVHIPLYTLFLTASPAVFVFCKLYQFKSSSIRKRRSAAATTATAKND